MRRGASAIPHSLCAHEKSDGHQDEHDRDVEIAVVVPNDRRTQSPIASTNPGFFNSLLDAEERELLLAALFHLGIDHAEDVEKGTQIEALVVKLGGDPDAVFFSGYADSLGAAPVPEYGGGDGPTRDD